MSRRSRQRLIASAVVLIALISASIWAYPSWQFSRDVKAAERALGEYDFETARKRLARCESRRPDEPGVHLLACRAARRAGDLAAAEEHYARYHDLVGQASPDAVLERALLDAQSGRLEDVASFLNYRLDAKDARSEEILEALARGSVYLYNFERTTFLLSELLAIAPRNPVGRLLKAQTMETLGRIDEGITTLQGLIRDFPENQQARISLGGMLLITNQIPEAAEAFSEARALAPDDTKALLGLARALLRLGRIEEFRKLLPDLEQLGDHSEALLHRGRFAIHELRWADAERHLARAVQLAPHDMEIHRELGVCLYQLGRSEEARIQTEKAREIEIDLAKLEKVFEAMFKSPRDPTLRLEAGRICLRHGQKTEGVRWLLGALELAPNYKPTHEALANYYAANGDLERAGHHRALAK